MSGGSVRNIDGERIEPAGASSERLCDAFRVSEILGADFPAVSRAELWVASGGG